MQAALHRSARCTKTVARPPEPPQRDRSHACAAALATVGVIRQEKLVENAERMGQLIRDRFAPSTVVRGLGLLLGIGCREKGSIVQERALAAGLIVGASEQSNILRLMPPLTITNRDVEEMVAILRPLL